MDGPTGLRLIRYWITRADGPGYLNRWPFGPKNRNATLVENRYETGARIPDNFEIRPVLGKDEARVQFPDGPLRNNGR